MKRPTVGDKVRYIGHSPIPSRYIGAEGVIIQDDLGTVPYLVRFSDNEWWLSEDNVKLIEETPSPPKCKLKPGDKVRVKSRKWYEAAHKCDSYVAIKRESGGDISFNLKMAEFCGKIVTIKFVDKDGTYRIAEDSGEWWWADEMFDFDEPPREFTVSSLISQCLKSFEGFSNSSEPIIKKNLPLIKPNKLLTNIKLD